MLHSERSTLRYTSYAWQILFIISSHSALVISCKKKARAKRGKKSFSRKFLQSIIRFVCIACISLLSRCTFIRHRSRNFILFFSVVSSEIFLTFFASITSLKKDLAYSLLIFFSMLRNSKVGGGWRKALNDVNLYFTAVIHSHKKRNLFNVHNTILAIQHPQHPCSSHASA